MEYELKHWGVKGMKWGVRRYQNKDGSLTPAGKKRYYQEADAQGYDEEGYNGRRYRTTKKGKVEAYNADPYKWAQDDTEQAKRLTNEAATITGKIKNLNDRAIRNQPKTRMDLSNMSDQDMRNKINRELLERQYNDMFGTKNVSKGREYAAKTLEVAGDVLSVAGSALAIALSIQALRRNTDL